MRESREALALSAVLALLAAACSHAVREPTSQLEVRPPTAPAAAPAARIDVQPASCVAPILLLRHEAVERSPALDRGASDFDRATRDYEEGHFLAAARAFLAAATGFLGADDLPDRRSSYENAAYAFATAGAVEQGRAALLAAVADDPALAAALLAIVKEALPLGAARTCTAGVCCSERL